MRIVSVTAHVVKAHSGYHPVSEDRAGSVLPGTEYIRMAPYPQLYPERTESVIVEIETDEGLTGWGECHAPVGAEVVATAVVKVVGPVVLKRDPEDVSVLFHEMLGTSRVRGHDAGYQCDAIAGVDTALWDLRGKITGRPISALLGGRFRDELPAYASGLRSVTPEARREEALAHTANGLGVKPFLGAGWRRDATEMQQLREAVGDDASLFADALWAYTPAEAIQLGYVLQDCGFAFFEAPIDQDDMGGHQRMAGALAIPIAAGEMLRTRRAFLPWLVAGPLGVCQPDLMHNGVSETVRIAALADTFNAPVALHVGGSTVVGMAATWQVASTLPNFLVQEHQPVMFEAFNRWLTEPLQQHDGRLVVPLGPGLGIDIDRAEMERDVDSRLTIRVPSRTP